MAVSVDASQVLSRLRNMNATVQREVKDIIEFRTGEIEMNAKRDAPGAGEFVATEHGPEKHSDIVNGRGWTPIDQAIGYQISDGGYTGQVFVEQSAGPVAVWVEMGTGQSAKTYLLTVPPEWKALAQKYYINGKGTILAQPYLLPNYFKQADLLIKDLEELLRRVSR